MRFTVAIELILQRVKENDLQAINTILESIYTAGIMEGIEEEKDRVRNQ